jgi:hypothetical protein
MWPFNTSSVTPISNKSKKDVVDNMFLDLATMVKHTLTLTSYVPYHFWHMA